MSESTTGRRGGGFWLMMFIIVMVLAYLYVAQPQLIVDMVGADRAAVIGITVPATQ